MRGARILDRYNDPELARDGEVLRNGNVDACLSLRRNWKDSSKGGRCHRTR